MRDEFMTVKEMSEELKIPERTLLHYKAQGYFPISYRFGKHVRVKRSDFKVWVSERPEALTRQWLQSLVADD